MNRRKIAAIILVAPLLWIYAVTLFHSHPSSVVKCKVDSELNINSSAGKDASAPCSICDYHVTKDVGLNQVSFDIVLPKVFHSYNSSIAAFRTFSCVLINSDRAPPTFLI